MTSKDPTRPIWPKHTSLIVRATLLLFLLLLACFPTQAGMRADLELLRDRCLSYAAGHAPTDTNTVTLHHGLYAQSPFSAAGEVDLAASGFSLAALPAAVANGVISSNAAFSLAAQAATQVRLMVTKSAAARSLPEIQRYGYGGMLCHYPTWDEAAGEFRAQPGVEFSSIDTTLLLYGLLVSANYFGGPIIADFQAARAAVRWSEWLDTKTPGHQNQFHMAYRPGTGFFAWWDWYTQEAMLICVWAGMSDPSIDLPQVWRAWRRDVQTYTPPGPNARPFTACTSYFGDPFTSIYGLAFLDLSRLPADLDGWDWFQQGQTAYQANVEFFKRERGYLDDLSAGFSICAPNGAMARPNGNAEEPIRRIDATLYTVAGGLPYYGSEVTSNALAATLSLLVRRTPGFFDWHGWPAPAVNATTPTHEVLCQRIIGQDIVFTGLAIDNYFTHRGQNLLLKDAAMRRALARLFPLQPTAQRGTHLPGPVRTASQH